MEREITEREGERRKSGDWEKKLCMGKTTWWESTEEQKKFSAVFC